MKITALVENTLTRKDLKKQHGLSLYVETVKHKLLIDLSKNGVFLENAKILGIDISSVDIAVITHGHFDHAGGLKHFLKANKKAKVYIQKTAFDIHRLNMYGLKINIGIDKKFKTHPQIMLLDGDLRIDDEIVLITNPHNKELLPNQSKLLKKEYGKYTQDDFVHEQSVLISDEKNLLISGCSHRGIVNILEKAKTIIPIDYCIGGFHFFKLYTNDNLLSDTAKCLNNEITTFYTCHCTGVKQYNKLRAIMGEKINYLHTGKTISL